MPDLYCAFRWPLISNAPELLASDSHWPPHIRAPLRGHLSARIAESPPKGSLAAMLDGQSYRGGFVGGSVGASVAPWGFAIVERVSTLNFL